MGTTAAFKLQDAGFTRQQVEALGEFTDGQAASKTDLTETKSELKADLAAVEHRLELKIAEVKTDVVKWLFGAIIAQTTIIVAAMKLLH
ncbi:MAG: hypothetical protein P4M00_24170 [Azospirillaceae bacterium]|nr:hypothetical protein [Azospirillaceae bacterium]